MNIGICDDDSQICLQIKKQLSSLAPECAIRCFSSGKQLLAYILEGQPIDILFLDIQMKDSNGMKIAKVLKERKDDTVLIFVTALKEYVFEAFDVSAFHYLLKPVAEEKLKAVFEEALGEAERRSRMKEQTLFFQTKSRNFTLSKHDILYVENCRRKVDIHTLTQTETIYATMAHMEELLGEGFYRCHRGYLVNLAYIRQYDAASILLQNGETIYLSKEKYNDFVKAYMGYLKQGGVSCV